MCCCTVEVLAPSASMASISPQAGHPTLATSEPASQKAGHSPDPGGSSMRAEKVPYSCDHEGDSSELNVWIPAPV